jgi:hypothetical protein
MDSLGDEDRLLAVTVQENCKGHSFEQFKRRLITYSQNKFNKQFSGNRRNESTVNQVEQPKGDATKLDSNKEPQKAPRQNDNNQKGSFQKRWHPKKNEANVVEEEEEEELSGSENHSDATSDAELNLVDIGIAPEDRDYIRVPKLCTNENATHYSEKSCVELNNVQLDNSGPKAALLRIRINGKEVETLVDSGATRSLVDIQFMKELAQGKIIPGARAAEISPVKITYADGRRTQIKNAIEIPLQVDCGGESREFRVQFLLLPRRHGNTWNTSGHRRRNGYESNRDC